MLEVKHLKRIYRVKKAEPVYALNDISLKFPEKGLVFILGKSGSGKSTLLNVMGGLDVADEGEIIIDGLLSGVFDMFRCVKIRFSHREINHVNALSFQFATLLRHRQRGRWRQRLNSL